MAVSDSRPAIGLTLMLDLAHHGEHVARYSMNQTFFSSIRRAGGTPVPLAPGDPQEMARYLPGGADVVEGRGFLDGLCLTAGGDLDPRLFGQPRKPGCEEPDRERDEMEIALLARVRGSGLPILALCRGIQVLNAAWGGTLIQDIARELPDALDHSHHEGRPRETLVHEIRLSPGCLLHGIFDTDQRPVNSLHHQAIDRLAPGLVATAWAPDGIIEAVELEPGAGAAENSDSASARPRPEEGGGVARRFLLGVQFHPEDLPDDPGMQRIFSTFVDAARAYRLQRQAR